MGIFDDIAAECRPKGERCSVGVYLGQSPDRAEWEAALDNPAFQSVSISRAIAKHGGDVKEQAVSRHRRRSCACR